MYKKNSEEQGLSEKQKQNEKLRKEMSKRFQAIRMSYGANQKELSYNALVNRISIAISKRPEKELWNKNDFCAITYKRWEEGENLPSLELLVLLRLYLDPHPNLNYIIAGDGPMFLSLAGPPRQKTAGTIPTQLKNFRLRQINPRTKKPYSVKEISRIFGRSPAAWRSYEREPIAPQTKSKSGGRTDYNSRSVPLYVLLLLHKKFGWDLNLLLTGA